jgi:tetratricopeptide (TPR) repeat protein
MTATPSRGLAGFDIRSRRRKMLSVAMRRVYFARSHDTMSVAAEGTPAMNVRHFAVLFLSAGFLTALVACRGPAPVNGDAAMPSPPRLFGDLGGLTRPVSGADDEAQRWFDQGLRLVYAFNHEAAARSFAEAVRRAPDCAMCHWGHALALGPNINMPMLPDDVSPAWTSSRRALALAGDATPVERALIEALAVRYVEHIPDDRGGLDKAYAETMADVVRTHPEDLDAAVLYAEALMDLSPWSYWGKDGTPLEHTPAILAALESVLTRDPAHIGAIHYYIHAVEASPDPGRAERYADTLESLSPGAGHLVHMPAHIYIRVGRYHDASLNNLRATEADQRFLAFCGSSSNGVYPLGYVPHNWHFLTMSASLEGNARQTMNAAQQTARRADQAQLDALSFMQQYVVAPLHAQVRFGRWDEILAATEPPSPQPFVRGIWHYARGLAELSRDRSEAAAEELAALTRIAADPAMAEIWVSTPNTAAPVLAIARDVLAAELAAARGHIDEAVASFTRALVTEQALGYMEPPDWPLPVRQRLAARLLDADRFHEAEQVYLDDLKQWPENGWSLAGLERALRAQGRGDEADAVRRRFRTAWAHADVEIAASHL